MEVLAVVVVDVDGTVAGERMVEFRWTSADRDARRCWTRVEHAFDLSFGTLAAAETGKTRSAGDVYVVGCEQGGADAAPYTEDAGAAGLN